MPSGFYKRTEKHREILSKAMKRIGNRPPTGSLESHPNWKGFTLRSGYRYIKRPTHPMAGKQGYIAEHRLVMEEKIGRFLTKKEVVHHIDGNILNNSVDNLELFSSHGQHTKYAHPEVAKKNSVTNRGIRRSVSTEFKKGFAPWNKGKNRIAKGVWI